MTDRWVVLDVGETIVDETRVWGIWADMLGIPHLTFMAGFGATLARAGQHRDVFELFNVPDWAARWAAHEAIYGGFQTDDLYPDAIPAMHALRKQGYRLAVIGNQPAGRSEELRKLGVPADLLAMSEEMAVAKPMPAFFARMLELTGSPEPGSVAYVGDRIDNDVIPATAAGMRAVWIRRGPWGFIDPPPDGVQPALVVDSLTELAERIEEAWPVLPGAGPTR